MEALLNPKEYDGILRRQDAGKWLSSYRDPIFSTSDPDFERKFNLQCFINDLDLVCYQEDADKGYEARLQDKIRKSFEEDRLELESLSKPGYALRGRKSIPRKFVSASFDYQLELPF